jgi:hypothetical protein
MLQKSARIKHQQQRLSEELDRIGSELDMKNTSDATATKREQYDNDWDDPEQDEDLWGDDSYF